MTICQVAKKVYTNVHYIIHIFLTNTYRATLPIHYKHSNIFLAQMSRKKATYYDLFSV